MAARLKLSLSLNLELQGGCILPAIYHHLIVPLAHAYEQRGVLELSPLEESHLLRQLVKCSFRRFGGQVDRATPLYVEDVTDELLDAMLSEALGDH